MKESPSASVRDMCSYCSRRSDETDALLKNVRSQYSGWWRSAKPPSRSERMKLSVRAACL